MNENTQTFLQNQINNLNNLINQASHKSSQLDTLNTQLDQKNNELSNLNAILENAKNNKIITTQEGTQDKTVWTNFVEQLTKLNWQNLKQENGRQLVATELKDKIEIAFPDLPKLDLNEYMTVIQGYENNQGKYSIIESNVMSDLFEKVTKANFLGDGTSFSNWGGGVLSYLKREKTIESKINLDELILNGHITFSDLRYYATNPSRDDPSVIDISLNRMQSLLALSYLPDDSVIRKIASYYQISSPVWGQDRTQYNLSLLPKLKSGKKISMSDIGGWDSTSISYLFSDDGKINPDDIKRLEKTYQVFKDFYSSIDWDAPQSEWIIDKEDYKKQIQPVYEWYEKVNEFIQVYNTMMSEDNNQDAMADMLTLKQYLKEHFKNDENYYGHIKPVISEAFRNEFDEASKKAIEELQKAADKLKTYDPQSVVVKGVTEAAQKIKDDLDKAQKAVDDKQKEIDDLNKQIDDLALTPDEKSASDLKKQKEQELENKQTEKIQLEQKQKEKREELEKIIREIQDTDLFNKNKGESAIAHGTNAFSSGKNSIAIGTNATAQNENAVAIGTDNIAGGKNSVAIGASNNVTAENSVAIGNSNEVTAQNSVVIGLKNKVESENVMVLGNNITVPTGYNGAVVLGNDSAPSKPSPTAGYTISGTYYAFAGNNPKSTVSVGKVGEERQITNVAAGRISETSTDAVNGSQLYGVIRALEASGGAQINQVNQRVDRLENEQKNLKAGIAGTAAIAGLSQVRGNGKSMVSAGLGNYRGQSAVALGYSQSSDNGRVLFRLSGSANTQGDVVSSVSLGYEW